MSISPAAFAAAPRPAAARGKLTRIADPFDDSYAWVGYESAPPQACAFVLPAPVGAVPDATDAGPQGTSFALQLHPST